MTTNSVSALDQIMSTIDLGPAGGSLQFMYAKLQLAQGMICKAQAEDYMEQIEQIQKDQQECADMVALARDCQQKGKNGEGKNTTSISGNKLGSAKDADGNVTCYAMPQELVDYMDAKGLSYPNSDGDYVLGADEWDYTIQSLTNYQETIGNKTQTLMVYLQDFMSQYNSYMQGASSAINEAGDVLTALATGR